MPPKKRASFGKSSAAKRMQAQRTHETEEERNRRLQEDAVRHALRRSLETEEERNRRLQENAEREAARRSLETEEERNRRLQEDAVRHAAGRSRAMTTNQWSLCAFNYNPHFEYASQNQVSIGSMSKICDSCGAKKWPRESPGMCCSNGKVVLPLIQEPPEPLITLLTGSTSDSKHFLQNIQAYNSAFAMTSFGANIITERGFMPTFKVQGQIYHRLGSLQPMLNEQAKYLQLYFISNLQEQAQNRCTTNPATKFELILQLQEMLHASNHYIRSFKYSLENIPTAEHKIIIDADKRPPAEHARRYNLPECNEVAVIIAGEEHGKRDIVLKSRDSTLQFIDETHRSYDALQYPLLFVHGDDGYHFDIPQAGVHSNKKVSCMDFYAYRFMVRSNSSNYLMLTRNLFHQFAVDVYAKTESERLSYIRTHQKELRCDQYVHLRDSINNDVAGTEIG